jgi:hypothetical protein
MYTIEYQRKALGRPRCRREGDLTQSPERCLLSENVIAGSATNMGPRFAAASFSYRSRMVAEIQYRCADVLRNI